MKRIIFHSPVPIDSKGNSGSHIRPYEMLKAFQKNSYIVDVVAGHGKERRRALKKIKENLKKGIKYDFLYSETSTMPMFLTEKHHLPIYSFVELNLFSICKRRSIPIGFFYRDIHWKFNLFKRGTSEFKKLVSIFFYFIELIVIRYYYSILFLPSLEMLQYLPFKFNKNKARELPPGINLTSPTTTPHFLKEELNLIYVGGTIPPLYDLSVILEVIKKTPNIYLNLVCRPEEIWSILSSATASDQISIIQASGAALKDVYDKSDLGLIVLGTHPYHYFSMPVKLFEAIGYTKPVIVLHSMKAASRFVSNYGLGYVIENEGELSRVIKSIKEDPAEYFKIIQNISDMQKKISWESRAREVIASLIKP